MERDFRQNTHQSLIAYLSSQCQGNFAFWQENNTIYYAQDDQMGYTKWPCEALLVQGLMRDNKKLYSQSICYVHSPSTTPSIMGQGMAKHYKFNFRCIERPFPQMFVQQPPRLQFIKCTAMSVMLQQTDWCGTLNLDSPRVDLRANGEYLHRLYLMAALRIIFLLTPKTVNLSRYNAIARNEGHNIAALLVSENGQVLAYGLNAALINNTYHAEVNMLQAYARSSQVLPKNALIYTTMKPCHMCAAMITQLLPDSAVIYAQEDPKAVGVSEPSGGMGLLSQLLGAKQIKLIEEDFSKNGNLIDALATITQTKQTGTTPQDPMFYLTRVIDTSDIFNTMSKGQRGLEQKAGKYNDPMTHDYYGFGWGGKHPEVPKVLLHLSKFLRLKLSEPEWNDERIEQDFP